MCPKLRKYMDLSQELLDYPKQVSLLHSAFSLKFGKKIHIQRFSLRICLGVSIPQHAPVEITLHISATLRLHESRPESKSLKAKNTYHQTPRSFHYKIPTQKTDHPRKFLSKKHKLTWICLPEPPKKQIP